MGNKPLVLHSTRRSETSIKSQNHIQQAMMLLHQALLYTLTQSELTNSMNGILKSEIQNRFVFLGITKGNSISLGSN